MFVRTLVLIATLSMNCINTDRLKILSDNELEFEKGLDKCVRKIVRHLCVRPHCPKSILTNVNDFGKISKITGNFKKGNVLHINYCSNRFLCSADSLNNRGNSKIAGDTKCKTDVFLLESVNATSIENLRNLITKTAYFIDVNLKVYVADPYANGNASNADFSPKLLAKCDTATAAKEYCGLTFSHASRSRKKWQNTTIKIYYRNMPPFVDYNNTGVEQKILKIVLDWLGMKNTSTIQRTTYQDDKDELTGNYTNKALLSLQHHQVDAVVGAFHATEETSKDFEGSVIYAIDTLNIVAPKSKLKPIWLRVMEIYSLTFCFILVLCLITAILFIHFVYKIPLATVLIWFLQLITDSPIYNMQKMCSFRVAMSSFLLFCLIQSTSFKSTLEVIYFSKAYEQNINTKDDARESGLKFYTLNEKTIQKMKNSNNENDRQIGNKMQVCTDIPGCLHRIAFAKDSVMLFLKIPILFAIPKYFMDSGTNEPLLNVGESFRIVPFQMMFQKNYPPFEDINDVLTRVLESGIFDFEAEKKIWDWYLKMNRMRKLSSRVLTLMHLEFVFIIWAVGVLLAMGVFLGELIMYNYF